MKYINRQLLASSSLVRFSKQYPAANSEIKDKLKALGNNPNPDDVDKAIGNCSWTNIYCSLCGEYGPVVSMMDCFDEFEVRVCGDCSMRINTIHEAMK